MQVTVTCAACSAHTTKEIESGSTLQAFHHRCDGPNLPHQDIEIVDLSSGLKLRLLEDKPA